MSEDQLDSLLQENLRLQSVLSERLEVLTRTQRAYRQGEEIQEGLREKITSLQTELDRMRDRDAFLGYSHAVYEDWMESRQILRDLITCDPREQEFGRCQLCDGTPKDDHHEPTCPWLRARTLLSPHPDATL